MIRHNTLLIFIVLLHIALLNAQHEFNDLEANTVQMEKEELNFLENQFILEKTQSNDDGSLIIPLERQKTERQTLRKVDVDTTKDYGVKRTWQKTLYEKVFGKSQETIDMEKDFKALQNSQKNHQRTGISRLEQTNYPLVNTGGYNFEYLMMIYCGSKKKSMKVTFDTGSDWLILQSAQCSSCSGDVWDQTKSTTYSSSGKKISLSYGSAQISGIKATDQFYLDQSSTIGSSKFQFVLIKQQDGISPSGGIMGFCRNYDYEGGYKPGPLFYYQLKAEKKISKLVFASYIADSPGSSFFQIGGYDTSGANYQGSITWISASKTFFWTTTTRKFIAGSNTYTIGGGKDVILDTGTSLAYLDSSYGLKLINSILSGLSNYKSGGMYYSTCDLAKYKSVFIDLGGYTFEIPPSTFVNKVGQSSCLIGFVPTTSKYWLFGDIFFRNYYTVFDEDNNQVGLAVRSGSTVKTLPYKT